MITEAYILDYFCQVIEEALDIFGFDGDDMYALRNSFLTVKQMRPVGTANQSTGEVEINSCFIGTDLYDSLHDTIRHEVAHLVTPIYCASHGKEWKRNAKMLRAVPKSSKSLPISYHNNKPIQIHAILENGEKVFVKAMLRRSSKYKTGTESSFSFKSIRAGRFYKVKQWIIEERA